MNVEHLVDEIADTGVTSPGLVAVRLAGRPVTYGELAGQIEVLRGGHADLAASPALFAALTSFLPYGARTASPVEDARIVGDAIEWLGRHHDVADRYDERLPAVG